MYSETVERSLSQKYLTNTKEWCVGRHTWSILQGYYPKIASSCSYSLADTWQGSCCLMRKQLIHHSKVAKLTMSTHGCSTANPYILWWEKKWHNNYNSLTVRMYFNWFHYFEQGKGPNPCIGYRGLGTVCGAQDEYLFKIVNRQLLFDRDLTMRKQWCMIKYKELVGDDSSDTGHQNNGFINGSECSAGLIIHISNILF